MENAIIERLFKCFEDTGETVKAIADEIDTTQPYLSKIKSAGSTRVSAVLIATFCIKYGYSAEWILTGRGTMKAKPPKTKEDKLIDIIIEMVDALLEVKGKLSTPQKELLNQAQKRLKTQS